MSVNIAPISSPERPESCHVHAQEEDEKEKKAEQENSETDGLQVLKDRHVLWMTSRRTRWRKRLGRMQRRSSQ